MAQWIASESAACIKLIYEIQFNHFHTAMPTPMFAHSVNKQCDTASGFEPDMSDTELVSRMRLVLAISGLLAVFVEPPGANALIHLAWLVFAGYGLYSATLCLFFQHRASLADGKLVHWLDLVWYVLIVSITGCVNSNYFLFFFFAILIASFHWGFEEGARVTIAAAILFTVSGLMLTSQAELPQLLMRTTFLLTLGYMCAHWGESKVVSKRRLALLRDVSRLSNPRFGVDHTLTSVLVKLQEFFDGSDCLLIVKDSDSEYYSLRSIKAGAANHSFTAQKIDRQAVSPFLQFPQTHSIAYSKPSWSDISLYGRSLAYDHRDNRWSRCDTCIGAHLADLLDAQSFIATPISFKKEKGRLYVASRHRPFSKADALFLNHIVSQVFPVIENIQLLDHLASDAALRERQRIAWDIHDTAIQPYIGLKLGLSAICNKASADNPLIKDLEKLTQMASQVAVELRHFAGSIKDRSKQTESVCLAALRRQAVQLKEFYGIDIAVSVEENLRMSDRLAAEILQIAKEGLSNIRKHTTAQRGAIRIIAEHARISMQIENECKKDCAIQFIPRSIAERAAELGGSAYVGQDSSGATVVHVNIPT